MPMQYGIAVAWAMINPKTKQPWADMPIEGIPAGATNIKVKFRPDREAQIFFRVNGAIKGYVLSPKLVAENVYDWTVLEVNPQTPIGINKTL